MRNFTSTPMRDFTSTPMFGYKQKSRNRSGNFKRSKFTRKYDNDAFFLADPADLWVSKACAYSHDDVLHQRVPSLAIDQCGERTQKPQFDSYNEPKSFCLQMHAAMRNHPAKLHSPLKRRDNNFSFAPNRSMPVEQNNISTIQDNVYEMPLPFCLDSDVQSTNVLINKTGFIAEKVNDTPKRYPDNIVAVIAQPVLLRRRHLSRRLLRSQMQYVPTRNPRLFIPTLE